MSEQTRKGLKAAGFGAVAIVVAGLVAGGTDSGGASVLAGLIAVLGLVYLVAGIWIMRARE